MSDEITIQEQLKCYELEVLRLNKLVQALEKRLLDKDSEMHAKKKIKAESCSEASTSTNSPSTPTDAPAATTIQKKKKGHLSFHHQIRKEMVTDQYSQFTVDNKYLYSPTYAR